MTLGEQIKKSEMPGASDTCVGEESVFTRFLLKSLKERDHFEELDVDWENNIKRSQNHATRAWNGFL